MKENLDSCVQQCQTTIEELEVNYTMFMALGGGAMKSMQKILLGQIEAVKKEKIMYQTMSEQLHSTISEQNLLAGLMRVH